jgi:hypothetical protein
MAQHRISLIVASVVFGGLIVSAQAPQAPAAPQGQAGPVARRRAAQAAVGAARNRVSAGRAVVSDEAAGAHSRGRARGCSRGQTRGTARRSMRRPAARQRPPAPKERALAISRSGVQG